MNDIDLRRIDLNLLVVLVVLMEERNVTRAAERLGRTQSAISHALGRLRSQLNDPLLVRADGAMQASPFGEALVTRIRPLLSDMGRLLVAPLTFDPASTQRHFCVALPDVNDALFTDLMTRVASQAPNATLEWVSVHAPIVQKLLDGSVDLATVPSATALPEGINYLELPLSGWSCFMRAGHPALKQWNARTWAKWPHLGIRISAGLPSPVEAMAAQLDHKRHVAAWVHQFSAVAPLLAMTDLIATLPSLVMVEALDRYGLTRVKPPRQIAPMPTRMIWANRLTNDPGRRWLADQLLQVYQEVVDQVERIES